MSFRTVIVESRAKLDYKMGYLVVRGEDVKRVLVDEIQMLIIENPAVAITGCLIEALIEKKVQVIFCDSKRNPTAELVPHHGCHDSSAKIRLQTAWSSEIKAIVWQDIISQKIRNQAEFLHQIKKDAAANMLINYIGQVEQMDATNREGHSAKVYFNALFGMNFTRSADTPVNAALNYGYGIILSAFNRSVCANGYLTQLGIFHSNIFNHFNLSCDLMEPFRILVDRCVFELQPNIFSSEEKHRMWNILCQTVYIDNSNRLVSDAIKIYVKSVFEALNDRDISLIKYHKVILP